MIEKRTMWLVELNQNISDITALYDTENEEIVTYAFDEDDDFLNPYSTDRFFTTKAEAEAYVQERRAFLLSKTDEVKAYVNEMLSLEQSEDFKVNRTDYLPRWIAQNDKDKYFKSLLNKEKVIDILRVAINQRMLCVNGDSIPLDAVCKISWYNEGVSIYASSESPYRPICTSDAAEMEAVRVLFGENASQIVHVKS